MNQIVWITNDMYGFQNYEDRQEKRQLRNQLCVLDIGNLHLGESLFNNTVLNPVAEEARHLAVFITDKGK